MAVYKNPFSEATQAPKIPDGKTIVSIGLSKTATIPYTIKSAQTNILLFGGLETCAVIWEPNETVGADNFRYRVVILNDFKIFDNTTGATGGVINMEQNAASAIHRWRLVSGGMKVSLTNNAEENDGWWEAVRCGISPDATNWLLSRKTDNSGPPLCFPFDDLSLEPEEMSALPSYVTGDLRDIKYTKFPLRPDGNEHDFIKLRNDFLMDASTFTPAYEEQAGPPPTFTGSQVYRYNGSDDLYQVTLKGAQDELKAHDFVNQMADHGYDSILLRIHGRYSEPLATAGAIPPRNSQLRLTFKMNQELIFDERSINARFHTKSGKAKSFDKTVLKQPVGATS
jgi:hypothetical protein